MITRQMRRSSTQLACNPALAIAAIAVFIFLTSGAGWLRTAVHGNLHETIRMARLAGAGLLTVTAYAVIALTARAVSGRPVPWTRHHREEVDLTPEPGRAEAREPGPDSPDPDLAPVVYPGQRPPAGAEPAAPQAAADDRTEVTR